MKAQEIKSLAKELALNYENYEDGRVSLSSIDLIFGPFEVQHFLREKDSTIVLSQFLNIGYFQFTNPVKKKIPSGEELIEVYHSESSILTNIPFEFPKDKKNVTLYVVEPWRGHKLGPLLLNIGNAVAKNLCEGDFLLELGGVQNQKFYSNLGFEVNGSKASYKIPPNDIQDVKLEKRYFNSLRNKYHNIKGKVDSIRDFI